MPSLASKQYAKENLGITVIRRLLERWNQSMTDANPNLESLAKLSVALFARSASYG